MSCTDYNFLSKDQVSRLRNDSYTFEKAGWTGASYDLSREPADGRCRISVSEENICAVQWYTGGTAPRLKTIRMPSERQPAAKKPELQSDDEIVFWAEPNMMRYKDNNGDVQKIYMPKGTFLAVCEYIKTDNFEELAKYPAWG